METQNDKILDKIRKMIAKQKSCEEIGSLQEAETFANAVQRLLDQYNISLSDVTIEELQENVIKEYMLSKIPSVSSTLGYFLMYPIAKYNWCRVYSAGKHMVIIGSKENIEVCKYIYFFCMETFVRLGKKQYSETFQTQGLDTFLRSYIQGAASGLHLKFKMERVDKEREEKVAQKTLNVAEHGSYGLIVQKNDEAVSNYVQENLKITKGRSRKTKMNDAYMKGVSDGQRIKINKGIE